MYGPIEKALDEIYQEIPEEILELAFKPKFDFIWHGQVNIPAMIREEIIDKRVRQDLNNRGASEFTIPLTGLAAEYVDNYTLIYRIPLALTQGREISSCLYVSFGRLGNWGGGYGPSNSNLLMNGDHGRSVVTDALSNLTSAFSPIPKVSTSNVRLIATNTILINDVVPMSGDLFLRCMLAGDTELSFITPPYYDMFAEFVVLATKAYVYRKLNISLDMGQLIGGQSLGRIREVVDSYSDAEQSYKDFRKEKLGKLLFLNDPDRMKRTVQYMVGGAN
mgnify:FL=1|jgi:hypothetical protein